MLTVTAPVANNWRFFIIIPREDAVCDEKWCLIETRKQINPDVQCNRQIREITFLNQLTSCHVS